MRVKQEKENRLFEAKDWSDLFEYTSETDDDSSGCGSAGYDGRDGPRERGEEELMSPPMQPNGGGSDDTCALGSYFSYDTCLSYNGGDVEYCDCHCLNLGCDDDDDGDDGSSIDWGERTRFEVRKESGIPYGYKFEFDAYTSESLGTGLAASGTIVCGSIVGGNIAAIPACITVIGLASIFSYCAAQYKGTRINWNIVTGLIDSHSCIENF
ncbi:MAG: hypothetical protein R6W73_02965 [Candidatus Saliniplasma sp.]